MEKIVRVPMEIVKIIPEFNGETRLLPLFIKKCEYILQNFSGDAIQNQYLFHVMTSRLTGEAANIVGEREHIENWDQLRNLLSQNFGDPRTEECLAMELENIKINRGESYLEFCHRIQQLRSVLFSKLNETIDDPSMRIAKQNIYSNTSLNVFLYNLPAYLVRLVRLRNVINLEDALKIVLEEQNFQTVYNSKNNKYNERRQFSSNHTNNSPQFSRNLDYRRSPTFNSPGPSQPSFSNNSFQMRNSNRANNLNHNYDIHRFNNMQNNNSVNRSAYLPSQQIANNAPRTTQNNSPPPFTPSGNNTDVTMRTASTRRVNYTNSSFHGNDYNQTTASNYVPMNPDPNGENFHTRASNSENE